MHLLQIHLIAPKIPKMRECAWRTMVQMGADSSANSGDNPHWVVNIIQLNNA
jgi:hypothetical protein